MSDEAGIVVRVVRNKGRRGMPFHDPKAGTRCVLRGECDSDRVRVRDGIAACAKCGANWLSGYK